MTEVEATVLTLIEEVLGLVDLDEFHAGLLGALRRAIPSDWVSLNDIGPAPEDVAVITDPPAPAELLPAFVRLRHENPLIAFYERTRDGRVYRFSDLISRERYHGLALYRECYAELGVEHQIAFTLSAAPDRILGVALSRSDPDYSDHERDVLERSRPGLIQLFRNAIMHQAMRAVPDSRLGTLAGRLRDVGLSDRQSEIVALLAAGRGPREIGEQLAISERTVGKHLQLAYRTLGVSSRTGAVTRATRLLTAS